MRQLSQAALDILKAKVQSWNVGTGITTRVVSRRPPNDIFNVVTVETATGQTDIDATLRREDASADPDKAFVAHIKDGSLIILSQFLPVSVDEDDWVYEFTISGTALDCAIEFDGYWVRDTATQKWNLITVGMPWIFWVDDSNILWGQHWNDTDTKIELATGVSKVRAMRGWKSQVVPQRDQGLIVAYIKSGALYYRNYATQVSLESEWEIERAITAFSSNVVDIALFRANDYRSGFIVQKNDDTMHWVMTHRNWGGFNAMDEAISAGIQFLEVQLHPAVTYTGFHSEEISAGIPAAPFLVILGYAGSDNSFMSVANVDDGLGNWGTTVVAVFNHNMTSLTNTDFELEDSEATTFACGDVQYDEKTFTATFTFADFNNATNDITLKFLGSGTTKGGNDQSVDPFSKAFTAQNLVPSANPKPTVVSIYNM